MRMFAVLIGGLLLAAPVPMVDVPRAFAQVTSGSSADPAEGGEKAPRRRSSQKWGAVARFEGSFYGAWAYDSENEVRAAVRTNCEKKHGKGKCNFTVFSGDECWSLARAVPDRGGWGQATGVTIETATQLAMKRCKDGASKCKKSFSFCADGSGMYNDR